MAITSFNNDSLGLEFLSENIRDNSDIVESAV